MNQQELDRFLAECLETNVAHQGLEAMGQHAPSRCAVWWGCLCGWAVWRPSPPPAEDRWLGIASRWVATGDDQLRRDAEQQAADEQIGICKWLLRGVVHSGGTLTFSGKPVEQPTPDHAARFTSAFVQHLLAVHPPLERITLTQTFVQLARQAITGPLPQQPA